MEKKFYYSSEDAFKAAKEMANEIGGMYEDATTDDRQMSGADYDIKSRNLQWSGECGAYRVLDADFNDYAIIGYWE